MVIERFRNQNAKAVYQRFREQGRLAPEGLAYVGSWVEASLDRCFQLMECDDVSLLQQWVAQWSFFRRSCSRRRSATTSGSLHPHSHPGTGRSFRGEGAVAHGW